MLPVAVLVLTAAVISPSAQEPSPNRQPQLAAAGSEVAMVFGSGHSILFAHSSDKGETFSTPSPVVEPVTFALGRHRGPRIAYAGKTLVVTAVVGSATGGAHGSPADGNLLAWRSTDGGKTWSKSVAVNDSPGSAREGLHAMAASDSGYLVAVWLDLRAPGTRLYGSFSEDSGATWSKNIPIYSSPDGSICQCCHPSLAPLGDREFAVMFRNALGGNRDMYVARLRDGQVASKPVQIGTASWKLNACPMDGGAVAAGATRGRVIGAFRRGADIIVAEAGASTETRVGAGKDVTLAVSAGVPYVAWSGDKGSVELSTAGKVTRLTDAGAFPALVAVPAGGVVAAWEETGGIRTRRLQ